MSWQVKQQKRLTVIFLILLVCFSGGCGYEECKTDKRYADKPGICGKIYRTEQSKKMLNKKLVPKIYWIMAFMFSPIILLIVFRIIRALLQSIADLIGKLMRILRL